MQWKFTDQFYRNYNGIVAVNACFKVAELSLTQIASQLRVLLTRKPE
jgi:hypothetical protein